MTRRRLATEAEIRAVEDSLGLPHPEPVTVPYRGVLLPVLLTFSVLNVLTVMTLAVAGRYTLASVFVVVLGLMAAAFWYIRDFTA